MSRKCTCTPCIFGTPTTRQGGRFWHEMSTLAPLSDLSYNAVGAYFPHSYTQWLSQENCQVSALYLIPVKFGVRFKMAKSPICPAIAVLELRRHATEVWLERSSWIFHTIFCCRFFFCSLGNTLPPTIFFLGGENSDFLTLPFLATSVEN